MQPYRIVDDEGFRSYTRSLEPRYQLPTRQALACEIIPRMYTKCVSQIKHSLTEASSLALTTDMWTSLANDAYMSVTAHYVTADFQSVQNCLDVTYFPDSHTANHLACAIEDSVRKWLLHEENGSRMGEQIQIYVVSDNAANIVAAMRQLPTYTHVGCFLHTLQLCINAAIKTCPDLIEIIRKGKKIAAFFHRSPKASKTLNNAQVSLKLPLHKLIQECPTRWNSSFDMMERLVEQKEPITLVLLSITQVENLTTVEWQKAATFVETMKPFKEVTVMMSADRYPTISMIIPILNVLKRLLQARTSNVIGHLQAGLLHEMQCRWPGCEAQSTFAISTVVDPRFKTGVFGNPTTSKYACDLVIRELMATPTTQNSRRDYTEVEREVTVETTEQNFNPSTSTAVSDHTYNHDTPPQRNTAAAGTSTTTTSATASFWDALKVIYYSKYQFLVASWTFSCGPYATGLISVCLTFVDCGQTMKAIVFKVGMLKGLVLAF